MALSFQIVIRNTRTLSTTFSEERKVAVQAEDETKLRRNRSIAKTTVSTATSYE